MNLSDALPQDPTVRTGTLPNGLRYYIRKNIKPEHRMEVRLAVHAGSVLEDEDQQGLAHMCEHMEFNGTDHFPKQDLVNYMESIGMRFGAHVNAYTSFDETVYMLELPTDTLSTAEKGMQVLQDWAGHATLDSVEIDKERGVVHEEWRLGRGAFERVQRTQWPVEYAGSQYAVRLPIGKEDIILHTPQSALLRFYHTWYRPDLMAVIAVGDFDVNWMENQIKSKFGSLQNPPGERERTKFTVPMHDSLRIAVASDSELQFNMFQMSFQRPDQPERTVGEYRAQLVRGLFVSMLNKRLQEMGRKPDAPFIYAAANDGGDLGGITNFSLFCIEKPGMVSQCIKTMLEELVRVKEHGFTASELEREKKELLRSYDKLFQERDKTESEKFADEYVRHFLHQEPFPGIVYENELAKKYVPGMTIAEVNELTKPLIANAGPVMLQSSLRKAGVAIPTESELRTIYTEVQHEQLAAYEDKVSNEPLMAKLPTRGRIVSSKSIPDLGVTIWKLSNGSQVVVKPTDFKNDQVLFSAQVPGGTSLASDTDAVSAEMADNIVDESGVGNFDASTLEKMLAGKVVSLSPSISSLSDGFRGSAAPADLETMFQLLYLYATSPRRDEDACKATINKYGAYLKTQGASPEATFFDSVGVVLTQHHPRTVPMSEERLSKVSLDKALTFYKEQYSNFDGWTFFVVGTVDTTKLKGYIEQYVASLPSSPRTPAWRDLGIRSPKGAVDETVYKGTEPKSFVYLTLSGPFQYNPRNRFVFSEMAQVLEIKLRETLREDMSGVYFVSVQPQPQHYPIEQYQMSIFFSCAPDRVNELIGAVKQKLDTMTMKAPEPTYVAKVKAMAQKEYEVNLKKNDFWLSALRQAYTDHEDPHMILDRANFIKEITGDDIFAAAKTYCSQKNFAKIVLYPEKK
ncbi:MAG: insulinase family protein [Bacteroidetes bacterium]|nr:insulinase family protein [Bacteroidota bacterium]